MTGLADMHCHLELFEDPRAIAKQCEAQGLRVLAVTASPRSWRKFGEIIEGVDGVRRGLGLHPQLGNALDQDLPLFEKLLPESRYVGEVGLDGGNEFASSQQSQVRAFERVLRMSSEHGNKILSVHSVRTAQAVLDLLESAFDFERGRVILHWFTGPKALVRRAAELGCFFSVNAQMLRSENGRAIAKSIPLPRLLTETDSPFVLDHGAPATPLQVANVATTLAVVRGIERTVMQQQLADNLRCLVTY